MLFFLKIWLYYLGSLSERITSTKGCIRHKRYTSHKYFHWENQKGDNPIKLFRIVRLLKAVIRSIQQLSISPPLDDSISHAHLRVCWVHINEGERLPIYTLSTHWPNMTFEPKCHLTWGPLLLKRLQVHITWCYTRDYCPDLQRSCTSRYLHNLDIS